jgi:hypothetical protein
MKTFLNKTALENTRFSFNRIGPLSYIVHKLSDQGQYTLEIYLDDVIVSRSEIECSGTIEATSQNVDIAEAIKTRSIAKIKLNSTNGYLLFYHSIEYVENRILIKKNRKIEFDSHNPQKGDLYVMNLLKPGTYKMTDASGKEMDINVGYPNIADSRKARFKPSIKISSKQFKKGAKIEVFPNQGIVVEIENNLKDFSIDLKKEVLPTKEASFQSQLKSQLLDILNKKQKHQSISRKHQWKEKK